MSDPLPIGDMYLTVPANPNSRHQLPQHMSRRVESKLESFHDNLSHFANCGMRSSLCDNLNLCGTARYNLGIRHKLQLTLQKTKREAASQSNIPAAWEDVIPFYNHSELQHVNDIAKQAGADKAPFAYVEQLQQDNGERFFSEYIIQINPLNQQYDSLDRCLCHRCRGVVTSQQQQNNNQSKGINTTTQSITTAANNPAPTSPKQTPAEQNSEDNSARATNNIPPNHRQTSTPVSAFDQLPTMLPQLPPTQPQQQHQHHVHSHSYPGAGAALFPSMPMPMPFIFPYPWMVATQPALAQSVTTSCCGRHTEWLMHRVGRPPHDAHCHVRRKTGQGGA